MEEKKEFECGEYIWENLQNYWEKKSKSDATYAPLAELLEKLGDSAWREKTEEGTQESLEASELAAYFYQVSAGKVPKKVFNRAFGKPLDAMSCGLKVSREPDLHEKAILFMYGNPGWLARIALLASFLCFGGSLEPRTAIIAYGLISWLLEWLINLEARNALRIIIALILASVSGFLVNWLANTSWLTEQMPKLSLSQIQAIFPHQSSNSTLVAPSITGVRKVDPMEVFDTSSQTLQQIVADLKNELLVGTEAGKQERAFSEKIVLLGLKEVLGSKFDLQYAGAIKGDFATEPQKLKGAKQKWVDAISLYQKRELGQPLGYMEPGGSTAEYLTRDIRLTPLFKFTQRTKPALQLMLSELPNDYDLRKARVKPNYVTLVMLVKSSLGMKDIDYTAAVKRGDRSQIEKMISAIQSYQIKNGMVSDGIIDLGKDTYQSLKGEVKAKLLSQ